MQKEEEMRKRKLCMCYELPLRIVFVINVLVFFSGKQQKVTNPLMVEITWRKAMQRKLCMCYELPPKKFKINFLVLFF